MQIKTMMKGFPGGRVAETQPCNAGNMSSIPGRELRLHTPQSN